MLLLVLTIIMSIVNLKLDYVCTSLHFSTIFPTIVHSVIAQENLYSKLHFVESEKCTAVDSVHWIVNRFYFGNSVLQRTMFGKFAKFTY